MGPASCSDAQNTPAPAATYTIGSDSGRSEKYRGNTVIASSADPARRNQPMWASIIRMRLYPVRREAQPLTV